MDSRGNYSAAVGGTYTNIYRKKKTHVEFICLLDDEDALSVSLS